VQTNNEFFFQRKSSRSGLPERERERKRKREREGKEGGRKGD